MNNKPTSLAEHNALISKALEKKKKDVDFFKQYLNQKARLYYTYQKVMGQPITKNTPCTELSWFVYCLNNGFDYELKPGDGK